MKHHRQPVPRLEAPQPLCELLRQDEARFLGLDLFRRRGMVEGILHLANGPENYLLLYPSDLVASLHPTPSSTRQKTPSVGRRERPWKL